jgi:hypothetical protein
LAIIFNGRTFGVGRLTLKQGGSVQTPPTTPPVVVDDHLPNGGYADRVGTRQHNSTDLLSAIYPVNTALSLGEFDELAPGGSYGLIHVTDTMTIGEFITSFNSGAVWGELSLVSSKADPSAADPGVLRLIATDNGNYDVVVRRPNDTKVTHADDLFVLNAANRDSEFPFDNVQPIFPSTEQDFWRTYSFYGTTQITETTTISSLLPDGLLSSVLIRKYYGTGEFEYENAPSIDNTGVTVGELIAALQALGVTASIIDGVMVADFGEFGGAITLAQDGYGGRNRFPEMFGFQRTFSFVGTRVVSPTDPIDMYLPFDLSDSVFIRQYFGWGPGQYTQTNLFDPNLTVETLLASIGGFDSPAMAEIYGGRVRADFGTYGGAVTFAQDDPFVNRFAEMFNAPAGSGNGGSYEMTPMKFYYGNRRIFLDAPLSAYIPTTGSYAVTNVIFRFYSDEADLTQFEDVTYPIGNNTLQQFIDWANTSTGGRVTLSIRGTTIMTLDIAYTGAGGNLLWDRDAPEYVDRFLSSFNMEALAAG